MAGGSSERDLDAWLAPFLSAMGRKTRRTWAPLYLRGLLGLLGPGDRKPKGRPMPMPKNVARANGARSKVRAAVDPSTSSG